MKTPDLGTPGATGLMDRTGTPSGGDAVGSGIRTAVRPAARASVAHAVLKAGASLGIAGADGPKSSNWQVLADSTFRWYFAGSVVSNFGTWLQNTAQVLIAYRLTHSVLAVGLVTCAQFSSPLVLGPWAGVLTHRMGNWRALMITQFSSMLIAATLAGLQFTHSLTVPCLFTGAILIGLAFTFALPALSVTVVALAPEGDTKRALAMDSVSYNLGRALAPVLSVLIGATVGFGWAFTLNAGSFLFFTLVLRRLRPQNTQPGPNRSKVMNGFRIARHDRRIMILLLMVAAVTIAADPILVLGPALARSAHASAAWSGVFIAALGAGNVIGSLHRTRRTPSIRRAATVLGLLSLCMALFAVAPWTWLSTLAALAAGTACLLAGATTRALLLQHAGPGRQAAVMAAWAVAWAGSKPIASLADGSLATFIGVRPTGILLALPALVPAVVLVLFPSTGRRIARQPVLDVAH
ncbi:MAG: MFS transporter [Actinomycetota bacterium]|nr:MFS transporter [Actinomycetota bacterium]